MLSYHQKIKGAVIVLMLLPGLPALSLADDASATDSTQVIPFDYFYGRIVGRQQFTLGLEGSRFENLSLSTGLAIAWNDQAEIGFPRLTLWETSRDHVIIPSSLASVLGWYQLNDRTRIGVTAGLWHDGVQPTSRPSSNGFGSSRAWDIGLRVRLSSEDSTEFDEYRGLFMLLDQPAVPSGSWRIAGDFDCSDADKFGTENDHFIASDRTEVSRTYSGSMVASVGLSKHILLLMALGSQKLERASSLGNRAYGDETESPARFSTSLVSDDWMSEVDHSLNLGITMFTSRSSWISLQTWYVDESGEGGNFYQILDYDLLYSRTSYESSLFDRSAYGVSVSVRAIDTAHRISLRQVLDNYCNYFGYHLNKGSSEFVLNARLAFDFSNFNSVSVNEHGEINGWGGGGSDDKEIEVSLAMRRHTSSHFYFTPTLNLRRWSSLPHLATRNLGWYLHQQRIWISCGLYYQSYSWGEPGVDEVSWNDVSSIDYLLGPLLRPGHTRAYVRFDSPYLGYEQEHRDNSSIFNIAFRGVHYASTKLEAGFSKGIVEWYQPSMAVSLAYEPWIDVFDFRRKRYLIGIDLEHQWQLGAFLRISALLKSHHTLWRDSSSPPELGYYLSHTWDLSFTTNLIL